MAELKEDWKRQIREADVNQAESGKSVRYAPQTEKDRPKLTAR
ncbi:hypothetical protein [Staphylococcus aureus]|nr:hypothetical protein [Staphylococcus aureus]